MTDPNLLDPARIVVDLDAVASMLAHAYGLTPIEIRRLPIGDATVDYRVVCAERTMVVKCACLYGVKSHYLRLGLLQADLDAFWLLRHRAAQILLERLAEVEGALPGRRP